MRDIYLIAHYFFFIIISLLFLLGGDTRVSVLRWKPNRLALREYTTLTSYHTLRRPRRR